MTTPQRLYDAAMIDFTGAQDELFTAIKRLGYAEGFEAGREFQRGKVDDVTELIAESYVSGNVTRSATSGQLMVKEKTAQELRDEIVERAKADVAQLEDRGSDYYAFGGDDGNEMYQTLTYNVEFSVNRDKRKVSAMLRAGSRRKGSVDNYGISKCAPTDCFNAHIGKAIALRRALGLQIPDEYLNAPQPTEVRVGGGGVSWAFRLIRWTTIGT